MQTENLFFLQLSLETLQRKNDDDAAMKFASEDHRAYDLL